MVIVCFLTIISNAIRHELIRLVILAAVPERPSTVIHTAEEFPIIAGGHHKLVPFVLAVVNIVVTSLAAI